MLHAKKILIIKVMAQSSLGRLSTHFEYPQFCNTYKLNFPGFLLFSVLPTFWLEKLKQNNPYLHFLHSLSYYIIFIIEKQLH